MSATDSVAAQLEQATALQRANRMEEAIAAYSKLLKRAPDFLPVLNRFGICLIAVGREPQALTLFQRACQVDPESAISQFNRGRTLASLGDTQAARAALEKALAIQPKLAIAWLYLGGELNKSDNAEAGLRSFYKAFEQDPELASLAVQEGVPTPLAELVRNARRALRNKYMALHEQLFVQLTREYSEDAMSRVRACLDIQHGNRAAQYDHLLQKPESIYFPGLPPTPWFAREQFPWINDFEKNWRTIRDEFLALGESDAGFKPYVTQGPTVPEAMQNLAGSHAWDSFHLYVSGERKEDNCKRCPETARQLAGLPLASMAGVAPEAFFSVLRPGAHIKPHHGIANSKVAVHLPLIVPENCEIRVGEETRGWQEGQCLIFDDSFEHEAWNRSDAKRVVLIFEVWNPHLTSAETDALQRLSACVDEWAAQESEAIQS